MNCAWCNPSNGGTDGVCDACIWRVFHIDPVDIHQSEFDAVPSYVERFKDRRETWDDVEVQACC